MSYKDKLLSEIVITVDPKTVLRPDRKSNLGSVLSEIFAWQSIEKLAGTKLKEAWDAAVKEKVITSDERLRTKRVGEHILAESDSFSCLLTVKTPRETFDKDEFIAKIAKKYKIDKEALVALADVSKKQGIASLTKRVVEV